MLKRVLGIDVSSTTIGWCLLELNVETKEINFVSSNFIKPSKTGNILDRLIDARSKIDLIIKETKPDFIAIEDIISFMKGHSTAKTIITLTSFNRMIGLLVYDYLNHSPELLNIMSIRHGIKKAAELKSLPKKEELPKILEKLLHIEFPWVIGKKEAIKAESYDKSDAMCCAYFYATKLKNDKNL